MDYFGKYVTDAQVCRLFPGAGQTGIQKAILTTFKNPLDDLYVNYTKQWSVGPPGRNCHMTLSQYESSAISKITRDAVSGMLDGSIESAIALMGNAHIRMTDVEVIGDATNPVIDVKPRAYHWNQVKRVFMNIKAMDIPPVPTGVETSLQKLMNKG